MEKKFNYKAVYVYSLIGLITILAYIFEPARALDLYDIYYDLAPSLERYTIYEFISKSIDSQSDFMYYISLMAFNNIGLSPRIMNMFYVCLYYLMIYKIVLLFIKKNKIQLSPREELFVVIAAFSSVLPIFVFSISRQLAAIDILFVGIYLLLKNKKILGCFICAFSLSFHLGNVIFIFILLTGLLFNYININRFVKGTILRYCVLGIVGFFFLFYFPKFFIYIQSIVLDSELLLLYQNSDYLNNDKLSSVFKSDLWYLRIAKPLSAFIMYICIVNIKKCDFLCNHGLATFVTYCFFLGCLAFIGDRIMMFVPILFGVLLAEITLEINCRKKTIPFFYVFVFIYCAFNIMNIYFERQNFFPF